MPKPFDWAARVYAAIGSSELIRSVQSVSADGGRQLALGDVEIRPLTSGEIESLERQGNEADDWSRVRVAEPFDARRIRRSCFIGDIVLGRFERRVELDGAEMPTGIYASTLANCVVGHDVLVRNVQLLSNYVVCSNAILWNCDSVATETETSFGNGMRVPVVIETGGREVAVFAEIDLEVAASVARFRNDRALLARYETAVDEYASRATSQRGIISHGAALTHTKRVRNSWIGPFSKVHNATMVDTSTLLSDATQPVRVESGACVTQSVLQWGSRVATMALVDRSVLGEESYAARVAKISDSIIGPSTGVEKGEVSASLVGPLVGFHHEALLIASYWPEGRGNVGYAAKIGSNHTSKAPDQECWPGEGSFFGLGANIKFPADFSRSPYSIFASGITTLPQKITYPFSLVNQPSTRVPGISPSYNEIIPAWLLCENLYAVMRNEWKHRSRNRARRTALPLEVFRPDIADLMIDALRRLENVAKVQDVYTDRELPGLGKNFMLEVHRQPAIDGYRRALEYYALVGLLKRLRSRNADEHEHVAGLLTNETSDHTWEHQRRILFQEFSLTKLDDALKRLEPLLDSVARLIEQSKEKDTDRGVKVIDGYADVHHPASEDEFVRVTWAETAKLRSEVAQWRSAVKKHE